jgi:hypothetical protein
MKVGARRLRNTSFGVPLSFFLRGPFSFVGVVIAFASSLRAKRSNPESLPPTLDCFVANAPRNDEVYPRMIATATGPTTGAV